MIPTDYTVGGQLMSIEHVERIENGDLGRCSVAAGRILIAQNFDKHAQSETSKTNTFYHELVHSILGTMGERELSGNEKFVCSFSSFLMEALTTAEYKEE